MMKILINTASKSTAPMVLTKLDHNAMNRNSRLEKTNARCLVPIGFALGPVATQHKAGQDKRNQDTRPDTKENGPDARCH